MMKPQQTPVNKTHSNGGKEGTKREDPNLSQKSKTQSGSLWDKGTNHVPKPPRVARSISERERCSYPHTMYTLLLLLSSY
jgi:hypothetical protein